MGAHDDSVHDLVRYVRQYRESAGLTQQRLASIGQDRDGHGEPLAETLVAVWVPGDKREPAEHWLVDLGARTVSFAGREAQGHSDWDVVGSSDAWDQVISGRLNLNVALRTCQLRYCDGGEPGPLVEENRLALLGRLLGLARW